VPAELINVTEVSAWGGSARVAAEMARLLAAGVRTLPADVTAAEVIEALNGPDALACVLPTGNAAVDDRSWRVAAATTKPVVLVPPGATLNHPHVERVLVPLDGSQEVADAMGPMAGLLRRAGVELVVLHVFEPDTVPAFWDQRAHANDAWAHAFAARSGAPPGTQTELRRGLPALHVVRTAVLEDVDLIAFGWSGARSVARAQTVRGSVAAAPMPVLLQQRSVGELERRGLNAKRGDWLLSHAGNETHPAQRAR